MAQKAQSYANHGRLDPPFHFFLMPVLLINFIAVVVRLVRDPRLLNLWLLVLAAAVIVAAFKIRLYALRVQDRVIRLEERLRLLALLPAPLHARIAELEDAQYIGLRFASDAELPALFQRALNEKLSRKDIKQAVVNWRADYSRV